MSTKKFFLVIALLQWNSPAHALGALVLNRIPDKIFSNTQIREICLTGRAQCTPESTEAYLAKGESDSRVFLIDSSKPAIIALTKDPSGGFQVQNELNLSGYRHSFTFPSDSGESEPLTIYPALYPTGRDSFSVAAVAKVNEMYSGGGANFEVADFIQFLGVPNREAHPEPDVVYRNVPFRCSQMIRACFSEKEYKNSTHCHEEREGTLTIDYLLDKQGNPNWTFKWHQTEWPAHVGKQMRKTATSRISIRKAEGNINSPEIPQSAPFCGGPQS